MYRRPAGRRIRSRFPQDGREISHRFANGNPEYDKQPLPARWSGAPASETTEPGPAAWWHTFGDPVLDRLIAEALRSNLDLRQTAARIRDARALRSAAIATAELYPKFNLAAFLGFQNFRLSDITPVGKSWSLASSVSMPIFNWGKLQANIRSKEAQQELVLIAYQSTLLNALKEVEDALVGYAMERNRRVSLERSVEASRLAVELANERYLKGLTAFLDVLETQEVSTWLNGIWWKARPQSPPA